MVKAIQVALILIGLLPYTVALADSTDSTLDKLEFHDSSAIARARNLRSLSLLTLAEFKTSRLYLGVNNRGLLGLHFNAATRSGDRCLEVVRMPYLEKRNSE
ncbi:MAG: hypothetical protein WBM87_00660 [Woeseiaceae bacterium]